MKSVALSQMRYLVRLLGVVELSALDRFPVLTRFRTPPIDLVGARCAEDLHPSRPIRQVAPELLVDVDIPGRRSIEVGEDGLPVTACLSGLLEFDLSVAVLTEHALEWDVGDDLVPADGTLEAFEQCVAVTVDDFQTHL